MKVLVDTTIWSLAYRRKNPVTVGAPAELAELIREGRAVLIGAIRQELLSGVRTDLQYHRLRKTMRAFADLPAETEDYENAATFHNTCVARGIQGSHTDFLICAIAARRRCAIFTADGDFAKFARVLPVELHQARSS